MEGSSFVQLQSAKFPTPEERMPIANDNTGNSIGDHKENENHSEQVDHSSVQTAPSETDVLNTITKISKEVPNDTSAQQLASNDSNNLNQPTVVPFSDGPCPVSQLDSQETQIASHPPNVPSVGVAEELDPITCAMDKSTASIDERTVAETEIRPVVMDGEDSAGTINDSFNKKINAQPATEVHSQDTEDPGTSVKEESADKSVENFSKTSKEPEPKSSTDASSAQNDNVEICQQTDLSESLSTGEERDGKSFPSSIADKEAPGGENTATDRTLKTECNGETMEKGCDKKEQPALDAPNIVSGIVLVQTTLLEKVEPLEDTKPVVAGCIDAIESVDKLPESLVVEPVDSLVDREDVSAIVKTDEPIAGCSKLTQATEATHDIAKSDISRVASTGERERNEENLNADIHPVIAKREDFSPNNEEEFLGACDYDYAESDQESIELKPDITECCETIGLSTDDEIEVKKGLYAQRRLKTEPCEEGSSNGFQSEEETNEDTFIEAESAESEVQCEDDGDDDEYLRPSKKRKTPTIRVIDIKKKLMRISKNNFTDSLECSSAAKIKKKRKSRSEANDDPFATSSSGSASEEISNNEYSDDMDDRVCPVNSRNSKAKSKPARCPDAQKSQLVQKPGRGGPRLVEKVKDISSLKIPAHEQEQLKNMVLKKPPKRDRFYDRSQDIPNSIYFESTKVPLHILHAGSSSSDDDEVSAKDTSSSQPRSKVDRPRRRRRKSSTAENTPSLQAMKLFLKHAGFRHIRYQKLWEGCYTSQERAEAILRFLQAKGLQGEPTTDKCRELRKQIQLENEAKVLDTSAIIGDGEGRITRQRIKKLSSTSAAPSSILPTDKPLDLPAVQTTGQETVLSQELTVPCHNVPPVNSTSEVMDAIKLEPCAIESTTAND